MSANMVTKQHIDTLVGAALEIAHESHSHLSYRVPGRKYAVVLKRDADRLGKLLWGTNFAGMQHYYGKGGPQEDWRDDVLGYKYHEPESLVDCSIGGLIKAVRSYVYQASGHPHWFKTEACYFTEALVDGLIEQLSEYQDADWLIDDYVEEPLLIEQINADRIAREANTLRGI